MRDGREGGGREGGGREGGGWRVEGSSGRGTASVLVFFGFFLQREENV